MRDDDTKTGVVIVLSWFGKDDTIACVESLLAGPMPARVLVVDNGSFDGTIEAVAERWPEVATLQTGENLGFAGGMNAGIRWALDADAAVVTVLNNDTIVSPSVVARLQELAAAGAAVSPEIYYRDRPQEAWFGGGTIVENAAFPRHLFPHEFGEAVGGVRRTDLLTGCMITASADTWRRVGLFDERFFLNFEDSEWSVRAAHAGVPLVVDANSRILHAVSATIERSAATLGSFYYVRNGLLFARLIGGSLRTRSGFVRHVGSRTLREAWKAGDRRGVGREARVLLAAVACDATRRYGPAPARLQRRIAAWDAKRPANQP